jgi:hypothetical protein
LIHLACLQAGRKIQISEKWYLKLFTPHASDKLLF